MSLGKRMPCRSCPMFTLDEAGHPMGSLSDRITLSHAEHAPVPEARLGKQVCLASMRPSQACCASRSRLVNMTG
jgi:hypothetical protein